MKTIISLDIETTGLDPKTDAIIEIGAVRFSGHRVEREYSSLICPNRKIPDFITGLTGIDDAMVRQAPKIHDVLDELASFINDSPILGHNIKFDLAFFQKHNLFAQNQRIDTFEVASVLLPSASRYGLLALCSALGVPLQGHHRGLNDAHATMLLFQKLSEQINKLPGELIAEIVRYAEPLDWEGLWPFHQALQELENLTTKTKPTQIGSRLDISKVFSVETDRRNKTKVIQVPDELLPIDPDEAAAVLEYGGPFSQYFDAYESRPEQVAMLHAVAKALSGGQHLMVEAGTGVGKSFAYLVPASYFALKNDTRVVISTNTINLQDQLINKDIPDLRSALNLDLRSTVLKGRSNYLCPRRMEILRRRTPATTDELRVLSKVLVWLLNDGSGDRNAITLAGPAERDVWQHISAEDDACTGETCLERQGGECPFFLAKQRALTAHILVVNHALLLADMASGNRVLPDYQHVIIDEAHHLEAATTGALSFRLSLWDIEHTLKEIGGKNSGILGQIISATRDQIRPSEFALIGQKVERATDLSWRFSEQTRAFFASLTEFINDHRDGQANSQYTYQERILPSSHAQPGWDTVEITWGAASESINLLVKLISELQKGAAELFVDGVETLEDVISSLGITYRQLSEAENMINTMIFEPTQDYVYWVEINPSGNRVTLNAAPVRIGPLVEKYLWHEKRSVILTSATLTTHGEFDYMRNTLSADEADELALGSPFDYETAAMLYIASDIAEPNAPSYQSQVEHALLSLCKATAGRSLILFTSYAQLKRTARFITPALAKADIITYEQGDGASANALLESFKSTDRAVLLGTRSFWEGVDIPGESLSVLVIVKLPFDVPTDPLVAARSETFEDPFNEYQLPEAILRFRQGFGRLIRTKSDHGIVVILDRRVLTKPYGRAFIESLPQCTKLLGSLADLPKVAARWLGA